VCSAKKAAKGITPGKAGRRYWKNVGLGFKTPREAIEGESPGRLCLMESVGGPPLYGPAEGGKAAKSEGSLRE
jgi:hypothetical protein